MEGWGWQSVHDPEVLPEVLERWKASIATGQPFDMVFPLRGADGEFRPFLTRVMPVCDGDGKVVRWFGTNTDITEQRKTEEALRHASEQRGLALEAAKLGAWDYRFDTGDVFWDERCRNMFGISERADRLRRGHCPNPSGRPGSHQRSRQAGHSGRQRRGIPPGVSCRVAGRFGALGGFTRAVFFEGDGDQRRAVRFVGVNMDITERRHAEERLRQTQKLESIGVLAGGVAHDFNNLLTVIMGSASAALAECPSCEHSQAILSASERAAYLTKQLLAYAGKANIAKLVDLTELVSQSTALSLGFRSQESGLSFNLSKDLPCLEADPSQIEQILMNLVINAGEAIPPKADGLIEIATSGYEVTPELARLHSRSYDVAAGAMFAWKCGTTAAAWTKPPISRIFDPFFTTKFTGRGLGLAAVHGIVRDRKRLCRSP